MAGKKVSVFALVKAKPGMEETVKQELLALVGPTRTEEGYINYDLHRSNDDPDVWVLYENWRSSADLEAHFQLPYMKEFVAHLGEILSGEMDLRRCSMKSQVAPWKGVDVKKVISAP